MFSMSRMIKKQIVVLVLLPVLLGAAVFYYSNMIMIPQYSAMATVLIQLKSTGNPEFGYEDVLASKELAKTVVHIAQSREIAAEVSALVNDPAINETLLIESVEPELLTDTSIVSIEYSDSDQKRAARVVNLYIGVLEMNVPALYSGAVVSPLDYAVPPDEPSQPRLLWNTLAAVLAGLAAAMIWAYVYDYFTTQK